MSDFYILKGKEAVACTSEEWGKWFEKNRKGCRVAKDTIKKVRISTVFLGLDHSFDGPPLIFETMIFGGKHDQYQERYTTWEEAEEGHAKAMRIVMGEEEP